MYKSPDFIKVDLDVKDNFASYSSCYRKHVSVYSNDESITVNCEVDKIYNYESGETDYQCFINDMGY